MSIAKESYGGMAGEYPLPLYGDLYDSFVDGYRFDYQGAILNSITCGGGQADLSGVPDLEGTLDIQIALSISMLKCEMTTANRHLKGLTVS